MAGIEFGIGFVPILKDKNGTRIELDSTRYGEDGVEYTITGLGKEYVWGRADGSTVDKRLKPEWLTSEHPDSLEQLEKDFREHFWFTCHTSRGRSERCTKYDTCTKCADDYFNDIIRRAKALAGVE